MRVTALSLRHFRSYPAGELRPGEELTVITGRNGAGKTNLLEALYFACTGRSCRTSNERECIAFGQRVCRLEMQTVDDRGEPHEITVGYGAVDPATAGMVKKLTVDGAPVDRLAGGQARPLVSVFLPDRLELVTGTPALRRGHLDQVVAARWPARVANRRGYQQALAQRNALLGAIRAGRAGTSSLPTWDRELARHGIALMTDRAELVDLLAPRFARHAEDLGLDGDPRLAYRPRSRATTAEELAAELAERTEGDLERGFTGHGPHRDDISLARGDRELKAYGSRGQQRLGLLALLLAEREELASSRGVAPLLLLDDVMSELDADRRGRLVRTLRDGGQSVITTTELAHVPGAEDAAVARIAVVDGKVLQVAGDDVAGAA